MKKIIALVMVIVSIFSVISMSAYAEDKSENTVTVIVNEVEFIFDADTTEEFRDKFIADYFNVDNGDTSAYGLTCTLFGHKYEESIVTAIIHKDKATDPRCLRQTYKMEACTRCTYAQKTLISQVYISCCEE
ncbi:MAG: hypothetical protein E7555_04720 [Ruminococcaceae bacterium]|nr:hypothetical protein [Oscillospiraceae bacterium]